MSARSRPAPPGSGSTCTCRSARSGAATAPSTPRPIRRAALDRFLTALLRRDATSAGAAPWAGAVTLRQRLPRRRHAVAARPPSRWRPCSSALRARFRLEPGAEVTVECNPESVTRGAARRLPARGGDPDQPGRAEPGRPHPAAARPAPLGRPGREAFEAAREAGFDNISVDLIYGLPGARPGHVGRDGAGGARLGPGPSLRLRPDPRRGQPLARRGRDRAARRRTTVTAQYWALARLAGEAGFEHYEVSNYARPGHRSRHNQIYWRAEEYLALGPGACGFLGDVRYGNVKPVERYCALVEGGSLPLADHEMLTAAPAPGRAPDPGAPPRRRHPGRVARRALRPRARRGCPRVLDAWRERGLLVESGTAASASPRPASSSPTRSSSSCSSGKITT